MNVLKQGYLICLLAWLPGVFTGTGNGYGQTVEARYELSPGTVQDSELYQVLEAGARKLTDDHSTVSAEALEEQLSRTMCTVRLARPRSKQYTATDLYRQGRQSVVVVGTLYKCPNCPKDHVRSASGFVIDETGVCVTSYHVFQRRHDGNNELTQVVMDFDGHVYPVTEVLAADKGDDIAIFRIDTGGRKLQALSLARGEPGEDAFVISHPHNMYYCFTRGSVSRYYAREGGEKMSVTAEFSQGSSGGPVFNSRGEVIGVVAATLSLYNSDNNLQMVSRETIPAGRIRAMTGNK